MDHEPIVIYRSVNREGETFALKPSSRERLRVQFGDVVLGGSRIFIAHDTHGDFREMHGGIAPHVIQLLTGKAADALDQLGGVVFRDPVTEDDVAFAAAQSMADKTTHFGRAGEFFAMSELLLRGWNVAVPVVDVGDDVFVVDDNDKTTYRLQVKSAEGASDRYPFNLSRRQLREPHQIELIYMLLMRFGTRWRFLVIPRVDLVELRDVFEQRAGSTRTRGAAPKADVDAKTDGLTLAVSFDGSSTVGWDADLSRFLDQWPNALPQITGGPGARGRQPVG